MVAGREEVLAEVAAAADDEIVGLGLTGQMHGSVFLDASGAVIRPALLWNDQRTAAECAEITERVGAERLLEIAGNPALTGFQAPKILWLRNHEPDAYARVASVLLPKDYIRLELTGERATDASDAAGTLLLDLRARDWSAEILDALEIPRAWLPTRLRGARGHGARCATTWPTSSGCRAGCRWPPAAATTRRRRSASASCARARSRRSIGTSGVAVRAPRRVRARPVRAACTPSATPCRAPTT